MKTKVYQYLSIIGQEQTLKEKKGCKRGRVEELPTGKGKKGT